MLNTMKIGQEMASFGLKYADILDVEFLAISLYIYELTLL